MTEELKKLRKLIDAAIDEIIEVCDKQNQEFPSLDSPADPSEFSPHGIRNQPVIIDAIALGISAASQLIVTLQSPTASITRWCGKASDSCILVRVPGVISAFTKFMVKRLSTRLETVCKEEGLWHVAMAACGRLREIIAT